MIDPFRWKPKDLKEAKEDPKETLQAFKSFRRFLFNLLVAILFAFFIGVIFGSFCMGVHTSIQWIMEWIK